MVLNSLKFMEEIGLAVWGRASSGAVSVLAGAGADEGWLSTLPSVWWTDTTWRWEGAQAQLPSRVNRPWIAAGMELIAWQEFQLTGAWVRNNVLYVPKKDELIIKSLKTTRFNPLVHQKVGNILPTKWCNSMRQTFHWLAEARGGIEINHRKDWD